jgi:hypothetical protein
MLLTLIGSPGLILVWNMLVVGQLAGNMKIHVVLVLGARFFNILIWNLEISGACSVRSLNSRELIARGACRTNKMPRASFYVAGAGLLLKREKPRRNLQ